MAEQAIEWANVERLVRAWLLPRVAPVDDVLTETRTDVSGTLVVLERTGGSGRWIERDVDVELTAVAAARGALWSLVARCERAMFNLAGNGNEHGFVDDVVETFGFAAIPPPPNGDVRRATATYSLTLRPLT